MTATEAAEQRPGRARGDGATAGGAVPRWRQSTTLARASVALTVLPIVVATVRGIARGWLPVGENALFQILAKDVLSTHPPLLGLASSASLITGTDVHHPGPLMFDLLAPPVALFGARGVAVGIGLINVAAVVGIAWAAWRQGGPPLVAGAMAVTSALLWSMGSELLYDPWNPHGILLPFLCFLVLVWCAASGDAATLPVAAVAGTLVLQTHLSYSLLVPVLGVWGVGALVAATLRSPAGSPERQRLRRWAPVAVVVLLLCWAQPLSQQFFGDGPGNLSELVASSSDSGTTVGPRLGTRLTARILTEPPFFLRPSFHDGWISSRSVVVAPRAANVPRLPFAVGSLVVLGAVLLALAWGARRRGDRPVLLLQATALLAVAMALATAIRAPRGYFGVPMHLYRWLWAVSAFAFLAVLLALVRRLPPRSLPAATMVLTIGVGILAVANLPTSDQGTIAPSGSIAAVEELNEQLGPLEGSGPYLVDVPERFNDPYGSAVMAELQDRGIPFRVQEGWERQVGPQRLLEAGGAEAALRVVTGDAARMPGPDADRVAFHDGLVPGERRDLEAAWADIAAAARAGELRLDQGGRAALARDELPWWQDRYDDRGLQQLRVTRGVLKLVEEDWLDVDPALRRTVDRFADLQERSDDLTVAVLREPLTPEEQRGET